MPSERCRLTKVRKRSSMIKTYSELCKIGDFVERYNYLRVQSQVGIATFGHERWLNQRFYTSVQWRQVRYEVIARDLGCDLGVAGHETHRALFIHHMNPIRREDLYEANPDILNPDYLICCSLNTHNAIHYGTVENLEKPWRPRRPGDTRLW